MFFLGLVTAAAASAALNVGVVLQAVDAREAPSQDSLRISLLTRLARRKWWMIGFLLTGIGFGLQVLALTWAPFLVVQPVLAAGLLLVLFLGVRLLHERIGMTEIGGVLGITGGIALLAYGSPTGTETVSSQTAVVCVTAALSAIALVPFALRQLGYPNPATFIIVASGLAFGADNITSKMVNDSLSKGNWLALLLWLAGSLAIAVIALITQMTALQQRPATLVIPLAFGVQTFLPVLLEPIYLQVRWGTAALGGVPLAAGLLLVFLGSMAVARTRTVSALLAAR